LFGDGLMRVERWASSRVLVFFQRHGVAGRFRGNKVLNGKRLKRDRTINIINDLADKANK